MYMPRIIKEGTKRCLSSISYMNSRTSLGHLQQFRQKLQLPISTCDLHTSNCWHKRRKTAEEKKFPNLREYAPKSKLPIVEVWRNITVKELAQVLNKDVNYVTELFLNEISGANTVIEDVKLLQKAVRRSGHNMRIIGKPTDKMEKVEDKDVYPRPPPNKDMSKPRPPVVTIMGHVDHGKTTLLDALRHSSIVEQEFGGITQHIGAFFVTLDSGARITFIDTPGHAAFSTMRARGANITDLVVLVVAADDGVMEQTIESIKMARKANVPILVAINKIDAPEADVERTENMLMQVGIVVEKFGGDVQSVPISALKRKNLDKLTEAIIVQAELLEIGADPTGPVEAVVVESKVHPYRGRLCTVIVQRGTLKKGDVLVSGTSMGRVRVIRDASGNTLEKVSPGFPAEVEGWKELPPAGELVLQVESEKRAKEVIRARETKLELKKQEEDLKAIQEKAEQHQREYKEKLKLKRSLGRFKLKPEGPRKPEIPRGDDSTPRLDIVIKADVKGTLEAVLDTLDTYDSEKCEMDLIHYDVGAITENDVELAEAFNAIIYAFNVDCPEQVKKIAEASNVQIKHHNVIYKLVDDVKEEINARLPQVEVEEVLGEATVLQQFDINDGRKKVPVAGCRCVKGVLKRSAMFRVVRNDQILFEGPLTSMRHLKEEVDTIKKDIECGLQLMDKTVTFQNGDTIICYQKKMEPQTTDWDPGF